MDGDRVREWEGRCIEERPPACMAACPLHVDARAMLGLMAAGDFAAAFALYARVVPFPAILSHICDHPCQNVCVRDEIGGAVRLRALERVLVDDSYVTLNRAAQRNRRPKRVAVVGGGLAGLTAAFDLAVKGHAVTVFETEGRVLDRLHTDYDEARLPRSAVAADVGHLASLGVDIRPMSRVTGGDGPLGLDRLIDDHDVVLLALGRGPLTHLAGTLRLDADERLEIDPLSCATSHAKVFAAPVPHLPTGRLEYGAYSPIGSMYHGRRAAQSVDRFLQGASLTASRTDEGATGSSLYVDVKRHAVRPAVEPADPARGYSRDEAMVEAARCLPCE
jgi:hypothetical protein